MTNLQNIAVCVVAMACVAPCMGEEHSLTRIQVDMAEILAELNGQLDRVQDKEDADKVAPEIVKLGERFSNTLALLNFPENLVPPTGPEVQGLYEIHKKIEDNRQLIYRNLLRIHECDIGTELFENSIAVFRLTNPDDHAEDVAMSVITALVDAVEAMNDQLERIKDKQTAKELMPTLRTIGRQIVELNRKFANPKVVGKPRTQEMANKRHPYEKELIDQHNRLATNVAKLKESGLLSSSMRRVLDPIM